MLRVISTCFCTALHLLAQLEGLWNFFFCFFTSKTPQLEDWEEHINIDVQALIDP